MTTNEEIIEKVQEIEKKLDKLSHEVADAEAQEEAEFDKIEKMIDSIGSDINLKTKSVKKTMALDEKNIEFTSVQDWQRYIWDNCQFKQERTDGSVVEFYCTRRKGRCRYEGCPENIKT